MKNNKMNKKAIMNKKRTIILVDEVNQIVAWNIHNEAFLSEYYGRWNQNHCPVLIVDSIDKLYRLRVELPDQCSLNQKSEYKWVIKRNAPYALIPIKWDPGNKKLKNCQCVYSKYIQMGEAY